MVQQLTSEADNGFSFAVLVQFSESLADDKSLQEQLRAMGAIVLIAPQRNLEPARVREAMLSVRAFFRMFVPCLYCGDLSTSPSPCFRVTQRPACDGVQTMYWIMQMCWQRWLVRKRTKFLSWKMIYFWVSY